MAITRSLPIFNNILNFQQHETLSDYTSRTDPLPRDLASQEQTFTSDEL